MKAVVLKSNNLNDDTWQHDDSHWEDTDSWEARVWRQDSVALLTWLELWLKNGNNLGTRELRPVLTPALWDNTSDNRVRILWRKKYVKILTSDWSGYKYWSLWSEVRNADIWLVRWEILLTDWLLCRYEILVSDWSEEYNAYFWLVTYLGRGCEIVQVLSVIPEYGDQGLETVWHETGELGTHWQQGGGCYTHNIIIQILQCDWSVIRY